VDVAVPVLLLAFVLFMYDQYYNYNAYYGDYNDTSNAMSECNMQTSCVDNNLYPFINTSGIVPSCEVLVGCFEADKFPHVIPSNATSLNIQSSFFNNLTFKDMKNFTQLQELSLDFNDLNNIETQAFQMQKHLEVGNNIVIVSLSLLMTF